MAAPCRWLRAYDLISSPSPGLILSKALFIVALSVRCTTGQEPPFLREYPEPLRWLDSLIVHDSAAGCTLIRVVSDSVTSDSTLLAPQTSWQREFMVIRRLCEKVLIHPDNRHQRLDQDRTESVQLWTSDPKGNRISESAGSLEFGKDTTGQVFMRAKRFTGDLIFKSEEECLCVTGRGNDESLQCMLRIRKEAFWPASRIFLTITFKTLCNGRDTF